MVQRENQQAEKSNRISIKKSKKYKSDCSNKNVRMKNQ